VLVACFLKDPRSEFKAHIDAPVEVELIEGQKVSEVIHLENVDGVRKGEN